MRVVLQLELAVLPGEARSIAADCFIVVDVLRATTTIAALFGAGLNDLLIVDDLETALRRAARDGRLLFGEVGGLPPEGFDYGNSPIEAAAAPVAGQSAVLFTTNGTKAIAGLAGRGTVLAGAIVNAGAVATACLPYGRVCVVCAGSAGGMRFALDDFAAAAVIVSAVAERSPQVHLGDSARLGCALASTSSWAEETVRLSHHARLLNGLGLSADVDFACRRDTVFIAPTVECVNGDTLATA